LFDEFSYQAEAIREQEPVEEFVAPTSGPLDMTGEEKTLQWEAVLILFQQMLCSRQQDSINKSRSCIVMYCFFHRYQILVVSFKDPQIILDPYICRSLPTKDPLCLGRRQPCGTEKLHFGGVSDEKGICYSLLFFAELHCYQLL